DPRFGAERARVPTRIEPKHVAVAVLDREVRHRSTLAVVILFDLGLQVRVFDELRLPLRDRTGRGSVAEPRNAHRAAAPRERDRGREANAAHHSPTPRARYSS